MKCSFAFPGTYGHECGAPAVTVFVKATKCTHNGEYYAGRCQSCANIKGGENADVLRVESINGQVNQWNGVYSE